MPKAAPLDSRIAQVCARFVESATSIKLETGIGEPEFTTALARALLYRIATIAPRKAERAMLNSVITYLNETLDDAIEQVEEARRDIRDRLASKVH
jgi:hypothetical protein